MRTACLPPSASFASNQINRVDLDARYAARKLNLLQKRFRERIRGVGKNAHVMK
jgi:hypothetical protein